MNKKTRQIVIGVWIGAVLLVGAIGAGNATVMRVANGLGALLFGLLFGRALGRGQTVWMVVYALLALLFVLFTVFVSWTAPVYELANEILDAL